MPGGLQTPLTDAEKAEIIEAYKSGESKNSIATRLSRHWSTVDKVISQSGEAQEADTLRNEQRRDVVASAYGLAGKVIEKLSTPGALDKIPLSKLMTVYNGIMANGREEQKLQLTYENVMREAISIAREEIRRELQELFPGQPALLEALRTAVDGASAELQQKLIHDRGYLRTEIIKKRLRVCIGSGNLMDRSTSGEDVIKTINICGISIEREEFMKCVAAFPLEIQLEIMEVWEATEPGNQQA